MEKEIEPKFEPFDDNSYEHTQNALVSPADFYGYWEVPCRKCKGNGSVIEGQERVECQTCDGHGSY